MENQLPFPITSYSTDSAVAPLVGQTFEYQGLKLMLVKAAAALTSPGGKFVLWSDASEDASSVASNADGGAYPGTVAGLVPAYLSGNVTSNAYLYVIRGGKENNAGNLNSTAIFSSAQVGGYGLPVWLLSSGVCGVHQISSTVQQGLSVAVLRQITSSSTWVTTNASFCAEVEVTLA